MKKLLIVLLAAALLISLAGCGQKAGNSSEPGYPEPETACEDLRAKFLEEAEDPEKTAHDIAEAIAAAGYAPFDLVVMPVEEGFLRGFDADVTGFSEGEMFAPMIGTIPFVGYVFTVSDAANVEAFEEYLTQHYDLRFNICTEAEEMVAGHLGDKVFFVMGYSSYDD